MCTNFPADVISMNTKLCSAMKTICPPGYYNNGLVTTNAHGHMKYGGASHCGDNREKIWFSEFHIYVHLVSARFEHCVS